VALVGGTTLAVEPAAMLIGIRDGLASPFDYAELPELRRD